MAICLSGRVERARLALTTISGWISTSGLGCSTATLNVSSELGGRYAFILVEGERGRREAARIYPDHPILTTLEIEAMKSMDKKTRCNVVSMAARGRDYLTEGITR